MRIAYFDCFAGASGDMILGALLDAGVEPEVWQEELSKLNLSGYQLKIDRVQKQGIAATAVKVLVSEGKQERHLAEIEELVGTSQLLTEVKETSVEVFRRLAVAEARVHGTTPDRIHFHEVGGVDAIIDIVGSVVGLRLLGVEEIYASTLPLGHGFVDCAHGRLPLPAPATLELLQGVPVLLRDVEGELVTPTGAAILTTLAKGFGPFPPMTVEGIGYGAGQRDFPFPNLLRLLVGTTSPALDARMETLTLLEANIDDLNPEFYGHLMERLFSAGALDVYLTPAQMKKNRPGVLLSVACPPAQAEALAALVFAETTTIGLRRQEVQRWALARERVEVETPYGTVGIKVAKLGGKVMTVSPEYEDCRRLALGSGVPLKEVYTAAEAAFRRMDLPLDANKQVFVE
jgi:uncharacterized protein (TIGR00299 family) protein